MKTLYYYDEKKLDWIKYPMWIIYVWVIMAYSVGLFNGTIYGKLKYKPTVQYRTIQYQDSTTVVYQPINPDSIKGDSKVSKDLKFYYRKNKK